MSNPPEIEGAEHHWREIGDHLTVHYAEAGDPEAPTVLLLAGWPQHHGMWAPVMARLGDRFRLIAPDLRGFGWSDAPGSGYDGDTFARDQVALLDAVGVERAHVIGHDWGGWTAILLGLDHPSRVDRLLVCNAPHPWVSPRPMLLPQLWRSWYAGLNAAPVLGPRIAPRVARAILSGGNVGRPFRPDDIDAYGKCFRDPRRGDATAQLYRYYFRVFAGGLRGGFRSRRLAAPTLLLFGERDRYVPKQLVDRPEDYERHADELRVELVPDSGHFIVDEKPDLVAERAREHFG